MNNTIDNLSTPVYVIEEALLEKNLQILADITQRTSAQILLALKAYAYYPSFSLINKYLAGVCCSGLYEATLAYDEFKNDHIHTYSPAFKYEDIVEIAKISHTIVFNTIAQLHRYIDIVKHINPNISIGIRINPQSSASPVSIYDPCAKYSRFGVCIQHFDENILPHIDGLHFHTLCEQDSQALHNSLQATIEQFGQYFNALKWLNIGGGHLITEKGYDREHLIRLLNGLKQDYPHLQIFLEPGEAVAWQCGILISTVLDIIDNGDDMMIVILDSSAEAHMPDVLAMPYRPEIREGKQPFKAPYTYRITGNTCLSGDIIGDYSFKQPLRIGDRIILEDMAHYTMVKNTLFNGIPLPNIVYIKKNGEMISKNFGYKDYKNKLG